MNSITLISNGEAFRVQRREAGVYEVVSGEQFLGYIERTGGVYVALSGRRYDRAVEAGQALTLARAASMLKPRIRSVA
ncbi:hypothetical protein VD659_02340 [Herbiconiux sp. 11R-BC]|uniref:hypothetical protein n=1 Tax=Herbiconiux sp. 11R-BC TaxID=3111637 RepID=UPI003C09F799